VRGTQALIALRRAMNALRLHVFPMPEGRIIGTGRFNTVGTGFIIIRSTPPTSLREEAAAAAPYSRLFPEVPCVCQVNSACELEVTSSKQLCW
jgi:hypothetical protein